MSDLSLKIPGFTGGVVKSVAPDALQPNQLADAENFLPWAATGGVQKVKVWHKDLFTVQGSTDDRIYTGDVTDVADASAALETIDPYVPRFDNIGEVFYFYSNCFDSGATNYGSTSDPNVPISISGNNWLTRYTEYYPSNTADLRAGFLLYKDVILTTTSPLYISVPVAQNGTYSALTHAATADLYYIDGSQPAWAQQASATVNVGAGGYGRLEFAFEVVSRSTAYAGEYYIVINQATATPETDGYAFLGPITYVSGTNSQLFGWATKADTAVTGEAVAAGSITPSVALSGSGFTVLTLSVASSHTFTNTPVVEGTVAYKGTAEYELYSSHTPLSLTLTYDLTAQSLTPSATAYSGATGYVTKDIVSYGGSFYKARTGTTGNLPTDTSKWDLLTISTVWGSTGLPTTTISADNSMAVSVADAGLTTNSESVTVNYSYASSGPLAEMMVYQKATSAATHTASATNLYRAATFQRKNDAMPASEKFRTDTDLPVWFISDKHSFFTVYQTVDKDDAVADALMVQGTMLNSLDQYIQWYDSLGNQAAARAFYYLPKFIGEVLCYTTYQGRVIFGGVGGLAIFDPQNMLEAASYAGKINTPWRDIVIPDIGQREESQYLINTGAATTDVHPPVIKSLMIYGDQPGRVVAFTKDAMLFQGGTTAGTYNDLLGSVGDVWTWDVYAVSQIGEGNDAIEWSCFFEGRGVIGTKRGDVYVMTGVPPVDWSTGTNTLTIRKERSIRDANGPIVFSQVLDTGLGFMVAVDQHGNLYTMDGSLIPQPFGEAITVYGGEQVNINVSGFSWEAKTRRLWIHSDGFQARGYYVTTTFTPVDVSARSFVWDAATKSFWPVCNPLDSETRTTKPSVFRDGNVSWSCGYYFDNDTSQYTFYLECDVAGVDPLPLHNSNEALYQPENSTKHATSTTAFLVTKLLTAEDHSVQVRYLQALARLIDGTDCTLSVVCEGVTTSLGTFNTSTDFATLASKLATLRINATARVNSMQIKLSIANQYADVVHNLLVKADLSGHPV